MCSSDLRRGSFAAWRRCRDWSIPPACRGEPGRASRGCDDGPRLLGVVDRIVAAGQWAGVRLLAQQLLDALGRPDHLVRLERQDRGLAGVHLAVDGGLQARAVLAEHLLDRLVTLLPTHRVEVDDCSVHFRVDVDRRDGDEVETFVVDTSGTLRTITGLTDGVPHKFRVKARNAIGTGDPSPVSDAYTPWTPVAPGAPVNVVASARPGQVDLDWDAPESDGGEPISDYVIEYTVNDGETWSVYSDGVSTSTLAALRGLSAGVTHKFRIKAVNARGTGPASTSSNSIVVQAPLANDAFSGAVVLTDSLGSTASSTVAASREVGEPNHGGYNPSASIWYRWTAPNDGSIVIDTRVSSFDTLLGVYTGSAVNALTTIATNDDAPGGTWSRVTVTVTAATTYYIAIDGYNRRTGSTLLNWEFTRAQIGRAHV